MDVLTQQIIAATGGGVGVIGIMWFFVYYFMRQNAEDRKIYLESHKETVQMTKDIAIETQKHLADCHREARDQSIRLMEQTTNLSRLQTQYSELSLQILKMHS